jgi:DNA-binding NarL/FixJ family response regulator
VIRVAVIDDDNDLLQIIGARLNPALGFAAPLLFTSSKNAFKKLALRPVDVALVDLVIPGDSGLRIIRRLVETGRAKTVLAYSSATDPETMLEALRAGAIGYWVKSGDLDALESALLRAIRGEPVISAEPYHMMLSQIQSAPRPSKFHVLSRAETTVLALAAEGFSCAEIAKRLQVSIHTVYVHNKRILKKLEVPDRLAAIARYRNELGSRSAERRVAAAAVDVES